MYEDINQELVSYVECYIKSYYRSFDKAHNISHMYTVINKSLKAAKDYKLNKDIIYISAALHDIGIKNSREYHHLYSGLFVKNNNKLPKWFSKEEIIIIKEAVEDHRASNRTPPRSIYGKVIAVADRDLEIKSTIKRSYEYALNILPSSNDNEHFENVYFYLHKKYGVSGNMVMWISTKESEKNLKAIEKIVEDKKIFLEMYIEIIKNILNKKLHINIKE